MTNAVLRCKDKCSRSDRNGNMLNVNSDLYKFGAFEACTSLELCFLFTPNKKRMTSGHPLLVFNSLVFFRAIVLSIRFSL